MTTCTGAITTMRRYLSLLILALLGPAATAGPDTAGDPLPEGALARMGSARWPHGTAVGFVAFLPDNKTVLSVSTDGVVHLWDRTTGKEQRSFATETSTSSTRTVRVPTSVLRGSIALTPDGKQLVVDGRTGGFKVWDV